MEIPKTLQRFADKIDAIEDLRGSDEGYWIHLRAGWINTMDGTHSVLKDTITECARAMRFVEPCTGDCCE